MAATMEELLPLTLEEEKLFEGQPKGFPFGDFSLEDVMLPEDEDMGVASDDEDEDEEELDVGTGLENILVVDNLPIAEEEKQEKLMGFVKKIYAAYEVLNIYLPLDEATKKTKGYAFVELATAEMAKHAREVTDKHTPVKNHTLAVTMFDDFEKYSKVPEEYVPPPPKKFEYSGNLDEWQVDRRGRDQFVIRHGEKTEIFWNDSARGHEEKVYERDFWTESFVQWSSKGNKLATMHRQGVAVWGGPMLGPVADEKDRFRRLQRFQHAGVRLIDFSPNETYLISYSSKEPTSARDNRSEVLINIFDTRSGKVIRPFAGTSDEYAIGTSAGPGGAIKWPVFKWAGGNEDKYFARLVRDGVAVFDTAEMKLLDGKSLPLKGVHDFAWSPTAPILSVFLEEQPGDVPAKVQLIQLPEKKELRMKNLMAQGGLADVKMYWHPQGDYLCVKVEKLTKSKKSSITNFELFSVKERDIPMDVLELPNKGEKVLEVQWEPKGNRFAVLHGDGPRPSISIYTMRDTKASAKGVALLGTFASRQVTQMHWSPQGRFMVLAGLKAMNGQLEFINVDDMETMSTGEHFMCTDVEWDPTGRYVATSVTSVHQMENGFVIWSFSGQQLYRAPRERFYQFSWRPRPASLLTPEQERDIAKNLRKFSRKYEEEDDALMAQADTDLIQHRKHLMDEWRSWYASKREWLERVAAGKARTLGPRLAEEDYSLEEYELTETMDVREEVITRHDE